MSRLRSQNGFTIIEVLVAALILGVMATGIAMGLESAATATGDQRMRAEADSLAAQDQERMRGLSDEQLSALSGAGQTQTQPVVFDGFDFTINSKTAAVTPRGASSCGADGASNFRITSTVSWTEQDGGATNSVAVDSLMARPTTGDLLTIVHDQSGNSLANVAILATSQPDPKTGSVETEHGTTDTNGCSLLAGVTPGDYTVQYSEPGYVSQQQSADPSFPVTVSATGTPPSNEEILGLGGSFTATLKTKSGATGEATALGYTSVGDSTVRNTPAAAVSSTPNSGLLYPFSAAGSNPANYTNNYSVWAGACPQQRPATMSAATVRPGANGSATVLEPQLALSSVTYNGTAVTPSALLMTFQSLSGVKCTDAWSAQVATPQSPGKPPSTGWLATPGQPYADGTTGRLTVCASYVTPSGATVSGMVTPTNKTIGSGSNAAGTIVLNESGACA